MDKAEQYNTSIISRSIAQNHKFRRKASYRDSQKSQNNQTTRQTSQVSVTGHIQMINSEPPRNHNQNLQNYKGKEIQLPTTKNQQNQQNLQQFSSQQGKQLNRRKSLSKQFKATGKTQKDIVGVAQIHHQSQQQKAEYVNESISGQNYQQSTAVQMQQYLVDHENSHSQNAAHNVQSTMFMTFQSSEKNFKRKVNAISQDKNVDSCRIANQLSSHKAKESNGSGSGGFLPDIYMSSNNKSLKQTPDPKRSAKKSKQFMLIEEHSNQKQQNPTQQINKIKTSEEELSNYFNYRENQQQSKFVSTTSTEPSEDQFLYKNGYSQMLRSKNTPKNHLPLSTEIKKNTNIYGQNIIIDQQYNGNGGRLHQSAFDNYYNMMISPKQTFSNDQLTYQPSNILQIQQSNNKNVFSDENSVHSSLNNQKLTYKLSDNLAQNAYSSPNTKGTRQLRKVSFEESILDAGQTPSTLLPTKESFSLTAQLSSKINSNNLSKIQLTSILEDQGVKLRQNNGPYTTEDGKVIKIDDAQSKRVISKQDIKLKSQKQGQKSLKIQKGMRRSSENMKEDIVIFKPDINYDIFMQPKTERVFENHSKRVEFRRRPDYQNKQLLMIYFDGVIGDIVQKNLGDDTYQMIIRHGATEGLQELSKHFQIVFYTHFNERYCRQIIDLFDKEDIVFDAMYQRLKAFKRTDEYCNYNQIYLDFDICSDIEDTFEAKISHNCLLLAPICMENDELKEKDGEDLMFQERMLSLQNYRNLTFKGLPIDSSDKSPMIVLVPHLRIQVGNYSVSMLNISNVLQSLLVTSCVVKDEQLKDIEIENMKEKDTHFRALKEEESVKQSQSRSPSPKRSPIKTQSTLQQRGIFMMTITTISPKNHFKKILATTRDKNLDQQSCNWLQAFYQVKKYKLFSLKTTVSMKMLPEYINKRKEDELLRVRQTVFKLKALYKSHIDKQNNTPIDWTKYSQQIQELLLNNEIFKQLTNQYKNDYYRNLVQILQQQSHNPLKELIEDLEDRLLQLETIHFSQNYGKNDIPLYRFMVLQGHQFQNYPAEVKMIIKEKETNLKRNLFNWVVTPSRNTYKKTLTNPLILLNGGQQTNNSQQISQLIQLQQETQFQPGYRIFSEQYQ